MKKRKLIGLVLTGLLLTSTVVQAKIISYEVKTKEGKIKNYATDQLVEGFLAYKQGENSEIYMNFIKDLKSGNYEAFQDDTKKYVSYDLIVQAFLEAKEKNKNFNVEDFVKQAKGIDLTTGTTTDEDTTQREKPKEEVKEETSDAIHYTREMIWNVMKSLAPNKLIAEGDDSMEQYKKWILEFSKSTNLDSRYYTLDTVKKLIDKKPEYDRKRHDTKESEIFDLDNFMKFKGLTINFDGLQDLEEHMGFATMSIVEPKDKTSKEEMKKILNSRSCLDTKLIRNIDGLGTSKQVYQCPWLNMAIWRPDVEQDVIKAVNQLRQSKGLKPLEYNVDLHAMGRYSAKRNNFELNYDGDVGADYGQGNLNRWLNKCLAGAESHCNPNCDDRNSAMSSYHSKRGDELDANNVYKLMDKNAGKLFGYDKEIGYITFADNTGLNGKGMIEMLDTRVRENRWTMTCQETLQFLDQMPNLKENILNPEMTKIGVGSIWNTPAGAVDCNGNTGIVIYTSK